MGITARTPIYAVSAPPDSQRREGSRPIRRARRIPAARICQYSSPLRHAPPRPSSNNSPVESTARALLIRAATVVGCGKSQTRPGEPSITSTSSAVMAGGSVLPVQAGCSSRNSSIMAQVVAGAERPVNTPGVRRERFPAGLPVNSAAVLPHDGRPRRARHVSAAGDIQDRNTHIGEVHQSVRALNLPVASSLRWTIRW